MKRFLSILCFAFLAACSDGSVSFDPQNTETVSVKAYLLRIGDSSKTRLKADTVSPADSVIFLSVIEPSRSIRITEFHWQVDSGETFSEFSHRAQITEPGKHLIRFTLLDRFADTLQDSATLWVAPEPSIDTSKAIPRNGSRGISPARPLSFAWTFSAENPLSETVFPFTLECDGKTLADTLLHSPEFLFDDSLPPLCRCTWTVSAEDDFGKASRQKILANFFTGPSDSGAGIGSLYASVDVSRSEILSTLRMELFDADGTPVDTDTLSVVRNIPEMTVKGLPAADYSVFFSSLAYPDFTSDTVSFSIQKGKVSTAEGIPVRDTTPPKIEGLVFTAKSLPWEDTLLFRVQDGGMPLQKGDVDILFDGTALTSAELSGDTLKLFLRDFPRSFSEHPLTISATDKSGNASTAEFYVSPGKSCIETLSEGTVHVDSSVAIPVKNVCPHLVPKRFFWDIDEDGSWDGETPANGADSAVKVFSGSLFSRFENRVRVYILYESGAEYESEFTLYVAGVSG